ncbi:ANTAR domain-containing protein [Streptomyces asoensis]|uniref:ANTAR domain-containing protein n=1 Tax=Streptomyces asoensis TaxID=249586 RepID=UPI0033C26C58
MTTSREQRSARDVSRVARLDRLERENAQLRHAVGSHAAVDQALGVLVAVHRIEPGAGFEVLREVSQHTNTRLLEVAESVIAWALGRGPLPEPVSRELNAAVRRHGRQDGTPGSPG